MSNFTSTLNAQVLAHGPLCLGIDPSETELHNWDLPDSASGAREFALRCIEAAEGRLGIIKPQVAFFERFGSSGFLALEEVLQAARDLGLVVIGDAKRGDIGSTMLGYAQAWFGDDSPLRVDALTVSPYMGFSACMWILFNSAVNCISVKCCIAHSMRSTNIILSTEMSSNPSDSR